MDRADARRGARAERVNTAQSPYGNRQGRKKQQKAPKSGLWAFIKSWSFFGKDEDTNMDTDSDSDDEMPDQQQSNYYPKTALDYYAGPISNSDDDGDEPAPVQPKPVFPFYDEEGLSLKVPGGPWRSRTNTPQPEPMAPPLAQVTRMGGKYQQVAAMAPPTAPSISGTPAPSTIGNIRTLVAAQVAKFLLNKSGKPLTSEEFKQIDKILKLAVDKNAPEGDMTLLESDPLLNQALQVVESAQKAQDPPKSPYMGTVVTAIPPDDDDDYDELEIIPMEIPGSKQSSESNTKVSDSGSDHYSSPPPETYGLPPFPREEEELVHDPTSNELDPDEVEYQEMLRMRDIVEEKTERLRKMLKLDEGDEEDAQAWEELERWKGLKSPTFSSTESVSDATISVGSSSGTSRGDEDEDEPFKPPEEPVDYNKGYTPAELMINPYDRISAFRNGTRRKLISAEDMVILRKKRAAAKQAAARLEAEKAAKERAQAEEAERASASTGWAHINSESTLPPIPARSKITMGLITGQIGRTKAFKVRDYDQTPTQERPETGDWAMSGKTKSGQTYTRAIKKRKANYILIETEGAAFDPPTEGPPTKRRKPSPEAGNSTPRLPDDEHLQSAIIVDADLGEDDNEEMIDETPEPPPIVITRASPSPARKKLRPRLRPVPDAARPKHFQYSPITPSPLRMVSAFDSPKQASVEIPPEAVPQKKEDPVPEEESYEFAPFVYRLGSIGPARTSKAVLTAYQKAWDHNPYLLPEYTMGSGKYKARYTRNLPFKRKVPKALRQQIRLQAKLEAAQRAPDEAAMKESRAAALAAAAAERAKPSTTNLNPDMLFLNIGEESRPSKATNGAPKSIPAPIPAPTPEPTPVQSTEVMSIPTSTDTTKLTNGTSKIINGSTSKLTNGIISKHAEEPGSAPPVRINVVSAIAPNIKVGSSKRKPVSTSTPSSGSLIPSHTSATDLMTDDIPPLRLPVLPLASSNSQFASAASILPPSKPRAPRLKEGPSAAARCYDWAAAGISPAKGVAAPDGFQWSAASASVVSPPSRPTSPVVIWNCTECMFANKGLMPNCICCSARRRVGPGASGVAPIATGGRAIAV